MSSSDKKAALVFLLYAVGQFVVPIALFRHTLAIFDALWFAGTIAPGAMAIAVSVWFLAGREPCRPSRPSSSASMHLVTLISFWLGLVGLATLNLWIIDEIQASC